MYDFYEKRFNYDQLLNAITIKNPNYPNDDANNMIESQIFADYAKYSSNKEKKQLEQILSEHMEVPVLDKKEVKRMPLLLATDFIFEIDEDHYFVDIEFINNFNQHVLNNKYQPLEQLEAEEEAAIQEMRDVQEAKAEYSMFFLPYILSSLTVKELKQLCRDFKIKGFSKLNEDGLIDLIEDAFMEDPYERFDYLTEDARKLISYFLVEDSNVIPYTQIDSLDTNAFMVGVDPYYNVLYMPIDIFESLVDYFEDNNLDPLDYIDPDDRAFIEEISSLEKLNDLTADVPEDIESAIAAFSEAGQDEGVRSMLIEMLEFEDSDSDDAKVMRAILDGKITSTQDLEHFLDELHNSPKPKHNKPKNKKQSKSPKNNNNVIDFNHYRK